MKFKSEFPSTSNPNGKSNANTQVNNDHEELDVICKKKLK